MFLKKLSHIKVGQIHSYTHTQNAFKNVICKMVAILSRLHRDNWPSTVKPPDQRPVHDDVIKWKHFPRYWPLVRGIHRSPVNSPHKCQWGGTLMLSLICASTNDWVNNRDASDVRRHQLIMTSLHCHQRPSNAHKVFMGSYSHEPCVGSVNSHTASPFTGKKQIAWRR